MSNETLVLPSPPVIDAVGYVHTVGTDGDYATVADAIADDAELLKIISNTTDVAVVFTTDAPVVEVLTGVTWSVPSITHAVGSVLKLCGGGVVARVASTGSLITRDDATSKVVLENITIDNTAAGAASRPVASTAQTLYTVRNCTILLSNYSTGGISLPNQSNQYSNLRLTGGGSSCQDSIVIAGSADGLFIDGTFNAANIPNFIGMEINNLGITTATSLTYYVSGCTITALVSTTIITLEFSTNNMFNCCSFLNNLVMTSTAYHNIFTGCRFAATASYATPNVAGQLSQFIGCKFDTPGSVTFTGTYGTAANDPIIVGCRGVTGATGYGSIAAGNKAANMA